MTSIAPQAYPSPPLSDPHGWIVFLHGWGANSLDLLSLAPVFALDGWQFYFLDAPLPHPQVPGGRMWYDLNDLITMPGLETSRSFLLNWLQTAPIDLSRTVLAGFSQGGAMTLEVGLNLPLAGLVVLSGYLHPTIKIMPPTPPLLIIHGQGDVVVPLSAAQDSYTQLHQAGTVIDYHELGMGHEINFEAIKIAREFILKTVP